MAHFINCYAISPKLSICICCLTSKCGADLILSTMSSFKRPKIIPPAGFYQNYAHVELSPSNKISVCGDQMQIVNWNFLHKKKVLTIDGATKNCRQWVQKLLTENQKNWRKISRRSTKKQKSTEEVSGAWMGMLIEAPLYVAPLPIWQSWNCGGPVHLDIKSKHAEDSRTLRSLSRTTYHMYQSYTPIMNCTELRCGSTPSSRCENLHESHRVACKGLDFTWNSTSIWNRAIYTILHNLLDFTYICNSPSFLPSPALTFARMQISHNLWQILFRFHTNPFQIHFSAV